MTSPPTLDQLPAERPRTRLGGGELERFQLTLRTVTPIMGGGTATRKVDHIERIRVASLRGALRFWWRALNGHRFSTPADLAKAERTLWGGMAEEERRSELEARSRGRQAGPGGTPEKKGGRSEVEIRLVAAGTSEIEADNVSYQHPAFYALWTARAQNDGTPPAERRMPGLDFTLEVSTSRRLEVEQALRAWLLFGGYGARTRRGCGSLTPVIAPAPGVVAPEAARWLPVGEPSPEELRRLLGLEPVDPAAAPPRDLPLLAGSALVCGTPTRNALDAWVTALSWLRDFRQAPGDNTRLHAREPGRRRPGRTRWPEPDKLRRLSGPGPWAHEPRHNDRPVWPRAAFGLPILGQFQSRDENNQRYDRPEPRDFELRWYDSSGRERSRLASPLIVKALPLADGRFVPIALWLNRGFPAGTVGLKDGDPRAGRSRAEFDQLKAPGDTPLFGPLGLAAANQAESGHRMRTAFFEWLTTAKRLRRVL